MKQEDREPREDGNWQKPDRDTGCGELGDRIQFIEDGLIGAVVCGIVLLDGQLELDIHLGLLGQRHYFRKLYNLETKKYVKNTFNKNEYIFFHIFRLYCKAV